MLVRDDQKFPNAKVYDERWSPVRQVWALYFDGSVRRMAAHKANANPDVHMTFDYDPAAQLARAAERNLHEFGRPYHKDPDYARELRHQYTGELLPRDIQTYENPYSGETVKILKSASDKEKRDAIAASYERAGRPVDASEIELMNG